MLPLLLACAGPDDDTAAPADDTAPIPWSYALDDTLRVTDVQAAGTHNSYHVEPDPAAVAEWEYTMPPLREQLALGIRQFELDIHVHEGELRVYHAIGLDEETTCATLAACLDALAAWSAANPAHMPLYVQLEPKDDAGGDAIDDYDALDATLLAHGPAAFTPAELRGDHATLAEALAADGWPTLGALRGRAIYGMDDSGTHRDAYRARGEGVLFLDTLPGDTDAALAIVNDPGSPDLAAALAAGMLTRVFADSAGELAADNAASLEAALASGGHFLSSDHPAPVDGSDYTFAIPDGTPARCNPVTAPPECTPTAVEDPAFIRY